MVEDEKEAAPPPPPPERVISGSVIGYRAWRIKDWKLYGIAANRPWVPGVSEATCDTGPEEPYLTSFTNTALGVYVSTGSFGFGPTPNSHPAPAPGCSCGITALARFAKKDVHWNGADVFGAIEAWSDEDGVARPPRDFISEERAEELAQEPVPPPPREPGRFFLHRNGFRAQFGKVVLLAVDDAEPAAKNAAIRALAREHGADVCRFEHLEDAAKEHGQLVPEEMLEWAREADRPSSKTSFLAQLQQQTMMGYGYTGGSWVPTWNSAPTQPPWVNCQPPPGYPGPPSYGKWRKNARVLDSKGAAWKCVKGGRPGIWVCEE